MLDKLAQLSHCLITKRLADAPIAYHAGQYFSAEQFANAVKSWVDKLQVQPFQHFALYTEDAYPFAVLLFALLHAGKQIWIPGNNRPGTSEQLSQNCQLLGDWQNGECFDYCLQTQDSSSWSLSPLNPLDRQLVIFTSGSTGQAKPITKCLNQFQLEIATLEKHWGEQLGNAAALATISHQHIYGLLFRVLWPLSAGRCFHSQAYINPETLIRDIQSSSAFWIASPAHLKRLDQYSPWAGIADLKAIFSSGGALPERAAQQIFTAVGHAVIEIYGSSETGGIAWRQQDKVWTLFAGMGLTRIDGSWLLHSPYLKIPPAPPFEKREAGRGFQLDDQITLLNDGQFILHGRLDRIVKIEGKRLSLVELEQRLMTVPWIDDAHALVITKSRDVVAAVVVLSQQGLELTITQSRSWLIRQLRKTLELWFESVVLPRKWLFVNTMPLTPQGKIEQQLLKSLLFVPTRREGTKKKFPQVLKLEMTPDGVQLGLRVPEDLLYFPDHFSGYPILPGVVQLAWVDHFGKLFFAIDGAFSCMEVVKFVQVIQPGDEPILSLDWKAESGKLYFDFSSDRGTHSSGRMVYGGNG